MIREVDLGCGLQNLKVDLILILIPILSIGSLFWSLTARSKWRAFQLSSIYTTWKSWKSVKDAQNEARLRNSCESNHFPV